MTFDCEITALGLDWEPGVTWVDHDTPEIEPYETPESLPKDVFNYLKSRGDVYGVSVEEILDKVPDVLKHHPHLIQAFVQSKDISHIIATSNGGSPNDPDNWMFEDGDPNSARQAKTMTDAEMLSVAADSLYDSHVLIDLVYNKELTLDTLLKHEDVIEDIFNSTSYEVTPAALAKAGIKTAFMLT